MTFAVVHLGLALLRLASAAFVQSSVQPTYLGCCTRVDNKARARSSTVNDEQGREDRVASLAGPYLVHGFRDQASSTFHLYSIDDLVDSVEPSFRHSDGALAWAALHLDEVVALDPQMTLRVHVDGDTARIDHDDAENFELTDILCRVLAQWGLRHHTNESVTKLVELQGDVPTTFSCSESDVEESTKTLFDQLDPLGSEIVEMVDRDGRLLGCVPRKLVHKHNLLHRGIGMFVTRDRPLQLSPTIISHQPDLYVHRRTATKRIFPLLYDMFVGGVSLAFEDPALTARREVAEELGLTAAFSNDRLSGPLLTCTVCTGYNRCVVVLFSYAMHAATETVQWQEDEVSWGSFVPYTVVMATADKSISRLVDRKAWPGRVPSVQLPPGKIQHFDELDGWQTWDYVPDGLLVWAAWLRASGQLQRRSKKGSDLLKMLE